MSDDNTDRNSLGVRPEWGMYPWWDKGYESFYKGFKLTTLTTNGSTNRLFIFGWLFAHKEFTRNTEDDENENT